MTDIVLWLVVVYEKRAQIKLIVKSHGLFYSLSSKCFKKCLLRDI